MWLGWRSAVQYFFFGPSRDAQIADGTYNIYKNKAFLATLRYCNIHPGDETALMIMRCSAQPAMLSETAITISGTML